MGTHYHIWLYRRDLDGTIRAMKRDDTVFPTRRKANYALSDGRQYRNASQVLQCVDGAFCQPMPEEMVERGMPFVPKYVSIEQLADEAKSIRPAAKPVEAMRVREVLCQGRRQNIPVGRSKSVPPERSLASVNVRASCSGEVSQRQAGNRLGG